MDEVRPQLRRVLAALPTTETEMCIPGCQELVHQAISRRGLIHVATAAAATAMVPAVSKAAPHSFRRVVDLTHTLSTDFPTFDGAPGVEMRKVSDFGKDGYNLYHWRLNEHSGTHLDAPIHFSSDGITTERIPAETLVVPLAVVNVADRAAHNPDYQVTRADLAAWERRHGRLPENCCVAMNSGWSRFVSDKARYSGRDPTGAMHFPGFDPRAVEWLLERKVSGLAVDTLSLDPGASKDFRSHVLWLSSGRWGLENVANLDKVPARGATLVVGLAKVRGATGGPARLFALL